MAYTKQEIDEIKIREILEPLKLTDETLMEIKQKIAEELQLGLKRNGKEISDLICRPTWIQDVPSGCEHGMFMVLTLLIDNFYTVFIHLKGENKYRIEKQNFEFQSDLNDPQNLFDFIVDKLILFVKQLKLEREPLPLAMVMSQPLHNINLTNAVLLSYKKNIRFRALENKDIGQLMKEALRRNGTTHLELTAIINAVTGGFVSCAWRHPNCKIAVIVDAGYNIGYLENASKIEVIDREYDKSEMFIITEMGNYGLRGQLKFVETDYDKDSDTVEPYNSSKDVNVTLEKYICDVNLPEIARKVILKAIVDGALFGGNTGTALPYRNTFKMDQMIVILSEKSGFYNTPLMFDKMGISTPSSYECSKVYSIVEAVVQRSAYLTAASLAAILEKIDQPDVVISIDGSLYCGVSMYHAWVEEKLKELCPNHNFDLIHAMDEYGRGAAIATALALRKTYVYENLNHSQN